MFKKIFSCVASFYFVLFYLVWIIWIYDDESFSGNTSSALNYYLFLYIFLLCFGCNARHCLFYHLYYAGRFLLFCLQRFVKAYYKFVILIKNNKTKDCVRGLNDYVLWVVRATNFSFSQLCEKVNDVVRRFWIESFMFYNWHIVCLQNFETRYMGYDCIFVTSSALRRNYNFIILSPVIDWMQILLLQYGRYVVFNLHVCIIVNYNEFIFL